MSYRWNQKYGQYKKHHVQIESIKLKRRGLTYVQQVNHQEESFVDAHP